MNQKITIGLMAISAIIVGLLTYQLSQPKSLSQGDFEKTVILPTAKPVNFPDLVDHTNAPFTDERLKGFWNIVFFAFTNCPDICPATMQLLREVKLEVNEKHGWGNYQVIFVTVDPARDTIERISRYVPHFNEQFVGLTGNIEDIRSLAKQLGIIFQAEQPDDLGNYNVDHSASIILLNPDGEMAGVMSAPHTINSMSSDLITLARHYADDHQIILPRPHLSGQNSSSENLNSSKSSSTDEDSGTTPTAPEITTETSVSKLSLSNAWARTPPPGSTTIAGYMTISNNSDQDIQISGVTAPDFRMAMIHESVLKNGISKMQHLDYVIIPAGGSIELKPNGLHLMLMGAEETILTRQSFELSLIDSNGNEYPATMQFQ
jgi:protein SCO1/2